jgi:bacillithiol biosynthesis cysteine-adding enzyme BshC
MIIPCPWEEVAALAGNRLYLDYVSGQGAARAYMTHGPRDYAASYAACRDHRYPRAEVSERLRAYNASLGAHANALANIEALRQDDAVCVVAGQQVGFLGGPVYTTYKIVHAIRLAERLSQILSVRVVPVFWLASEDHDLTEINHTHYVQSDGEIGRVSFRWEGEGRPIADLPVSIAVRRAYEGYFDQLGDDALRAQFAPRDGEDYVTWHGRLWADLFSERGLVLVEPSLLRAPARGLFRQALSQAGEIRRRLTDVAARLRADGYSVALDPESYGQLFTFDADGRRVRVEDPAVHVALAQERPECYSADAALRPPVADAMLPVVASVLGPGEIAYQAMLRPLYELFGAPQPVLAPRQSYTVLTTAALERLSRYGLTPQHLLAEESDPATVWQELAPPEGLARYAAAREALAAALAPLRPHLQAVDPTLDRNWEQTLANAWRGLDKLQDRGVRALLSQQGLSRGELQSLRNLLLPRGRPQERVLPLPHLLQRFGSSFIERLYQAAPLDALTHHILVWEPEYAYCRCDGLWRAP